MDDLVVWLRARLNEDEQTARKLHNLLDCLQWVVDRALGLQSAIEWNVPRADQARLMGALPPEPDGLTWVEAVEMRGTAIDPARVLRETDASRVLLTQYEALKDGMPDDTSGVFALEAAIRAKAAVYADRPGYREEWRP